MPFRNIITKYLREKKTKLIEKKNKYKAPNQIYNKESNRVYTYSILIIILLKMYFGRNAFLFGCHVIYGGICGFTFYIEYTYSYYDLVNFYIMDILI